MLCLGTRRKKKGKETTQSEPAVNIEREKHIKDSVTPVTSGTDVSIDLSSLEKAKRGELQKLCKEAGLKANGKNVEMIKRLMEHYKHYRGEDQDANSKDETIAPVMEDSQIKQEMPCISTTSETLSSVDDFPESLDEVAQITNSTFTIEQEQDVSSSHDIATTQTGSPRTTKWCIVEGILKQDCEIAWRRVRLKGGRPVVPNRFGMYIKFNLTPSYQQVPSEYEDNFICGACVTRNEHYQQTNNMETFTRTNLQNLCDQENHSSLMENISPVGTQHEKEDNVQQSFKRKRDEIRNNKIHDPGTTKENKVMNVVKKQKKEIANSKLGTPVSTSTRVFQRRDDNILLPRNLQNPRKQKVIGGTYIQEDPDFAKRVEEIMKNTTPGSAEEQRQIMGCGTSNAVRRSRS